VADNSPIKISLKGLAKFMTSSDAGRRKVLRDFKFPQPEGKAQAVYYREARGFISSHNERRRPEGWLSERAATLASLSASNRGATAVRLGQNSRALLQYERNWGGEYFEILPQITMALIYGRVRVSVFPDLHVRRDGREQLVKLEFSNSELSQMAIKIICQGMFEAVTRTDLGLKSSDVMLFDVPRGAIHRGARMGSRLAREIEASAQNIIAMWDSI
jgi:hypothetical protein